MWKWKTVCQAAAPQALIRLMPSAPRTSFIRLREPLRGEHRRGQVIGGDLEQVGGVLPRHDQCVARRRRVDVHEGDGPLVGVDHLARDRPGDDPAEQAVGSAIRAAAYSPESTGGPR